MKIYLIVVKRDGREWFLGHIYAGTAVFDSPSKAQSHIDNVKVKGNRYKVITLELS